MKQDYTVRKIKGDDLDNYGLYFRGKLLDTFASRKTAEKYKRISELERGDPRCPITGTTTK